jgi:hypothetical protein
MVAGINSVDWKNLGSGAVREYLESGVFANLTPPLDPLASPFQPAGGIVSADNNSEIGYSEDEADKSGDKKMADN